MVEGSYKLLIELASLIPTEYNDYRIPNRLNRCETANCESVSRL